MVCLCFTDVYTNSKGKLNILTYLKMSLNVAPRSGVVEFKGVSLRYDKSLPFVLHDVNFKTKSCEKIGIVGRTGAGKSSIIQVSVI
jgi:ABC-type multidrug transport system fused ATPase/permease subunit